MNDEINSIDSVEFLTKEERIKDMMIMLTAATIPGTMDLTKVYACKLRIRAVYHGVKTAFVKVSMIAPAAATP